MVKGVSRQVIVVHSPDPELFEQAIFILKDGSAGVSDKALLQEADRLLRSETQKRKKTWFLGPVWAFGGAAITAFLWGISILV